MVLNETSLKTNNAISEIRRVPEVERSLDVISAKYLHSRPVLRHRKIPTGYIPKRILNKLNMQSCRVLEFLLNDWMTDQPYSSSLLFLRNRDSSRLPLQLSI